MRIAVFSDIHGNPYATHAVLDAIKKEGGFDTVIMDGDVALGGSDPAACVDMLREAEVDVLVGNADVFVFDPQDEPPTEAYRGRWPSTIQIGAWTAEKLGEERVDWLRELPFERRFSMTQNAGEDLLVVHANPKNVFDHILPPVDLQPELFGQVEQPDDDAELLALFEGVEAGVMAYGHFHYTSERMVNGIKLVNVSPSSYSAFTLDKRARYTEFIWQNSRWYIEQIYVDYDYRQEGIALLKTDYPGKENKAKMFE